MKNLLFVLFLIAINMISQAADFTMNFDNDANSNEYPADIQVGTYNFKVTNIPTDYWVSFVVDGQTIETVQDDGNAFNLWRSPVFERYIYQDCQVSIYVWDENWGNFRYYSWYISMDVPDNPVAKIESPSSTVTLYPGDNQTFKVSATDADGDLSYVRWYLDGALKDTDTGLSGSSDSDTWSNSFSTEKTYTVKAVVYDETGRNDDVSWTVYVRSNDPVASRTNPSTSSKTINIGTSITFRVDATDIDGDLDYVQWYRNGSPTENDDTYFDGSSNYATRDEDFNNEGTVTIKAVVVDDLGNSDDITWTIYAQSHAPSVSRLDPTSSSLSLFTGDNQTFKIRATDEDGNLDYVDWSYSDDGATDNHNLSGSSDDDSDSHTFNKSGTYIVKAKVYDETGKNEEINWTVSVTVPKPDLDITNYQVANAERNFYRGDKLTWTCTVENTGNLKADKVPLVIVLSTDANYNSSDILLKQTNVADPIIGDGLTPGQTDTDDSNDLLLSKIDLPTNLVQSSYYYIIFRVDPSEVGGEGDYVDNEEYIKIYIKPDPKPDLDIKNYEVANGERNFYKGDKISWTWTVENIGDAEAQNVPFVIVLSNDNNYDASDILLKQSNVGDLGGKLNPGSTDTDESADLDLGKIEISTGIADDNNYYIIFRADPDETGGESAYGNNEESIYIQIKPDPKPDLDITNYEVANGERSFYRGDKISWTWTVENIGDAEAQNVPFVIVLSNDNNYDASDILLKQSNVGDLGGKLNPGSADTDESADLDLGKIEIPTGIADDNNYYIIFRADSDETGGESAYGNNEESIYIQVKPDPKPDLDITNYEVANGERNFYRGDKISWTWTVENIGDAEAQNVPFVIVLSNDETYDASDILLKQSNVGDLGGKLNPGSTDTDESADLDLGKIEIPTDISDDKNYFIIFRADPNETGGERNYDDNEESILVSIGSPKVLVKAEWRDASVNGSVITSADVCQNVYLYVETENNENCTLTGIVYDSDGILRNDLISVEPITINVTNGVGIGQWQTVWVDDFLKSTEIQGDTTQLKSAQAGTTAELYFKVLDGNNELGKSNILNVEDNTPPLAPVLNAVNNGEPIQAETYETSVEFSWNKPAEENCQSPITQYRIQVATDQNFTNLIVNEKDKFEEVDGEILASFNLPPGNFYWRVGAYDKAGNPLIENDLNWSADAFSILKGLKTLNVPYYYQGNTYYCWASSLSMFLKYYGFKVNFWDLAEMNNEERLEGSGIMPLLVMEAFLNKDEFNFGQVFADYSSETKKDFLKEIIFNSISSNNPVWIGSTYAYHVTVITGFEITKDGFKVKFSDPHYPPYTNCELDFDEYWHRYLFKYDSSKENILIGYLYRKKFTNISNNNVITIQICHESYTPSEIAQTGYYGGYTTNNELNIENDYSNIYVQHHEFWDSNNLKKIMLIPDGTKEKEKGYYYFGNFDYPAKNFGIQKSFCKADVLFVEPFIYFNSENLIEKVPVVTKYILKDSNKEPILVEQKSFDLYNKGSLDENFILDPKNKLDEFAFSHELSNYNAGNYYLEIIVEDTNGNRYDSFEIYFEIVDTPYAAFELVRNEFEITIFKGNNIELSIPVSNLGTQDDVFQIYDGDQLITEAATPYATCSNIDAVINTNELNVGTYNFEYVVRSKNEPLKTRKVYLALNVVEANAPLAVTPECDGYETTTVPVFEWTPFSEITTGLTQKGYQLRVWREGSTEIKVYDTGLILDASGNSHTYTLGAYSGYDDVSQSDKISLPLEYGATYHWHVRYLDENNNWTPWSNEFDYCTFDVVDPIPSVQILYPENGYNYFVSEARISGTAQDKRIVDLVEFRVNGGAWQTATGTWNWYCYANLLPGENSVDVRAKGINGDYSNIESVKFYFTPELGVTPEQLTFGSTTDYTQTAELESSLGWNVTEKPSWLTITPNSGTNGQLLTLITNSVNTSGGVKQGIVTIANTNGQGVQIAVQQQTSAAYLSTTPALLEFKPADNNELLNIFSNTNWNITESDEWINVNKTEGSNDEEIEIFINRYEGEGTRTGSLTISGVGVTDVEQITIVQRGIYLNVPATLDCNSLENTYSVDVLSNVDWVVIDNAEWLQIVNGSPGQNDGYFSVLIDENTTSDNRTAKIIVSGEGMRKEVTVTQSVSSQPDCELDVIRSTLTRTELAGSYTTDVLCGTSWHVVSLPDWVSLNVDTGEGNGQVTINWDENLMASRTGEVVFGTCNDVTDKVVIYQDGPLSCEFDVVRGTLTRSEASGNYTTDIICNSNWGVISLPDWVTVDKVSGYGDGQVTISWEENSGAPRSGEVVFTACGDVTDKVVINQDGPVACELDVVRGTITRSESAGNYTTDILSNTTWDAVNYPDWVSLDRDSGEGNGQVTISWDANSGLPRSGEVVFTACGDVTDKVTINQDGPVACELDVVRGTLTRTKQPAAIQLMF